MIVDDPLTQPPVVELEDGWIKHVSCNGARWHVQSWSTDGVKCTTRCSEPRCIINKPADELTKQPTKQAQVTMSHHKIDGDELLLELTSPEFRVGISLESGSASWYYADKYTGGAYGEFSEDVVREMVRCLKETPDVAHCPRCKSPTYPICENDDCVCQDIPAGELPLIHRYSFLRFMISARLAKLLYKTPLRQTIMYFEECPHCGHIMTGEEWAGLEIEQVLKGAGVSSLTELGKKESES